ncbi:MAG: ATP-binding protein [Cytophagales bacterium]|nr:ATP-binding protein [Cytophagales bacterium]
MFSKHAKASHVLVQLSQNDDEMNLTVEDNGIGMNPDLINSATGSGWTSIRTRTEYLKGKLDVQSSEGNGTSVHITIPIS